MMRKTLVFYGLLFYAYFLFPHIARSSHIVGGEFSYRYLGSNQYEMQLTIYRNCFDPDPGAEFDNPAAIGIFDSANVLLDTIFLPFLGADTILLTGNDPCLVLPSNICYEYTTYIDTLNLPPIPGGYQLAYQRCCRTNALVNVFNVANTGATFYASIPDSSIAQNNNSPAFNLLPPAFICVNTPFVFDHSATDPDGDSLVYEIFTPLAGGTSTNTQPIPPSSPPYSLIIWNFPYSLINVFGGVPLAVNSQTGLLTATPNTQGEFLFGVRVKEYRNGVLVGKTLRDYQINIVDCQNSTVASFQTPVTSCGIQTVQFANNSTGASSYHWDFGAQSVSSDTSNLPNPSFTYPDTGIYQVMLIAYSANGCVDTTFGSVFIYAPFTPEFTYSSSQCSDTVYFYDTSSQTSGNVNLWNWNFGDSITSSIQNPVHIYSQTGSFIVTLIASTDAGCTDTVQHTVVITQADSMAQFTYTPVSCQPAISFSSSFTSGLNYWWSFGDTQTSGIPSPSHTYSSPGTYSVILIVTDSAGCKDTVQKDVTVSLIVPDAAFSFQPLSCNEFVFTNQSQNATQYIWNFGDGNISVNENPNHSYTGDGGFSVTLIALYDAGCEDTMVQSLTVTPTANAVFDYEQDKCTGAVVFNSPVLQNISYHWNFGNGDTSDLNNPVHTYSGKGEYEVTLIFNRGTACADTAKQTINYSAELDLFIATIFSPNGDGINDMIFVRGTGNSQFRFIIYDRWGEKVFETTDKSNGWDGTFRGKAMNAAVFVYYVEVSCPNGYTKKEKGNITLIK